MPIIRKKLDPNTIYPETVRYNPDTDTVESLVNGDWVENPAADPRTQTTIPARITTDTRCDAAQSVSDALQGKIDEILVAIDNAGTVFTIGGIILSLFTFGVFGVFISIALTIGQAMLDAGTGALSAALTPTVYETFTCILYCQFDNSGRLKAGGLGQAQTEVTDQIGGLGAVILNSMLSLAGEGGINNLAALGTSTGACIDCDCPEEWCFNFDFASSNGGWSVVSGQAGQYNAGSGWGAANGTETNYNFVYIERAFDESEIISFKMTSAIVLDPRTATPFGDTDFVDIEGHILETAVLSPPPSPWEWTGSILADKIQILLICGVVTPEQAPANGVVNISSIEVKGIGTNPFGTSNCE